MLLCSLILIFLCTFWLPLLPGLLEIVRPSDAQALPLDRRYSRLPAFFAQSFRGKIAHEAQNLSHATGRVPFLRRKSEYARWEKDVVVASGEHERDVVVASGRVLVNDGAQLTDVVAEGDLYVGDDVRARVLSSGKSLRIGDRCVVDRWAHAEGDLVVGSASSAGAALTALGTLSLHGDVRFQRAFGMPIRAVGGVNADHAQAAPRRPYVIMDGSTITEDIICKTDVVIGARCTVLGSVKTHGALFVGADTRIEGHVVARKDVVVGENVSIRGHVFAEDRVAIGAGASVGTKEAYKSVYGGTRVALDDGAMVWGAIVNEPTSSARRTNGFSLNALAIGAMFAAALFVMAPAQADQTGPTVTLQQTNAVFSPGTYGDENITTLSARVPVGQNQPGLSIATGTGSVLSRGTSDYEFVADDYLKFSNSAFAYASVLTGSGSIFPSSGAYAEVDTTVRPRWSAGIGAGFYSFVNGVNESYVSIGPTYYFPNGTVSLLARPQWFTNSGASVTLDLAAQYGRRGRWIASMRLENGLDPAIVGSAPFVPAPAEHGNMLLVQWQQWLSPLGGVVIGGELDNEDNRATSQNLYTRRALSLGLFFAPTH